MFTKWKKVCILLLIISFCIVGFASAANGSGNGTGLGQKFKSQLIDSKAKSLVEPTGAGTYTNPYVFETCVTYQFWGGDDWAYGWTDMTFIDPSGRSELWYLSACPMANWAKVQTGYSEGICPSARVKAYWWGGYYEGSFSSPMPLSTGYYISCIDNTTFYYIVNGQSPPEASFTATPTSGPCPLTVTFTDTSTGSPASWLWDFGDGNISTEQNPVHVYTSPGTFYVDLTVSNCGGSDTTTSTNSITGSASAPVADFTGTPTSGTRPLTVQFTDTSTGYTASWLWDFGDGSTSTDQNPSHEYDTVGVYDVDLTVANSAGNDTKTKDNFISVLSSTVNYYVFADGVGEYHGYENNLNIPASVTVAHDFYTEITDEDRCHEDSEGITYCWNERSNPADDNTGSVYWSKTESVDTSGANSVEFAFHAGHGWEDGILFGTANQYHKVFSSNMSFSRAKWVVLSSCNVLNATSQENWESVFDGLHILLSYDTVGMIYPAQGPQFVERMRGDSYLVTKIKEAWELTLKDTIQNSSIRGAYMWADPCDDDYLPGYGPFEEPTENNGEYTIHWDNFECI